MKTLTTDENLADTIQPKLVWVTPTEAADWLTHANLRNRAINRSWVEALTREILEGRWLATGDAIRFDEAGELIDGQHRLSAIVRADIAVPVFVIRGLPLNVRDVIDTGRVRTTADILKFSEYRNTAMLGAAARIIITRRAGGLQTAGASSARKVTNAEILQVVRATPDLEPIVAASSNSGKVIGVKSRAAWAYCMWVLDNLNPAGRAEFETSLMEATTDGAGDPRLAFLRYLTRNGAVRSNRPPIPETIFITFRAWNAWRTGEEMQRMNPFAGTSSAIGAPIPDPVP